MLPVFLLSTECRIGRCLCPLRKLAVLPPQWSLRHEFHGLYSGTNSPGVAQFSGAQPLIEGSIMRSFATLCCLFLASSILFLLTACGGGSPPSPSPPQKSDFSVSVSPVSASAVLGNSTSPVTVSVDSKNRFNKPVNITLLGLPSGVTAAPSSFALQPGAMQPVTFSVSGSVSPGEFSVTVTGASGDHSHNAQLILTTEPLVMLY
jgi:hypothetical protein